MFELIGKKIKPVTLNFLLNWTNVNVCIFKVFLKANIDVGELTNTIISQNYVGSIVKVITHSSRVRKYHVRLNQPVLISFQTSGKFLCYTMDESFQDYS